MIMIDKLIDKLYKWRIAKTNKKIQGAKIRVELAARSTAKNPRDLPALALIKY